MRGLAYSLLFVGGLIAVATVGVHSFAKNTMFVDADGNPLDFAGKQVPCPHCKYAVAERQSGYSYACSKCGHKFHAKYTYALDADPETDSKTYQYW